MKLVLKTFVNRSYEMKLKDKDGNEVVRDCHPRELYLVFDDGKELRIKAVSSYEQAILKFYAERVNDESK